MSAKANVRKIFPKAGHIRYSTNGFRGYTLIWSERFGEGKRLGEGKTTAEAWTCAWKHIQQQQAQPQSLDGKIVEPTTQVTPQVT